MSNQKHEQPPPLSQQYSKSSTKRLYDAVFKIIDHDELQVSSFDPPTQPITNGQRVLDILTNQSFLCAIIHKIKLSNLINLYPILQVTCVSKKGILAPLDINDLQIVFGRFGQVYSVVEGQGEQFSYYVLYTNFTAAYVAMKLVNGFMLRHTFAQLNVKWCMSQQYLDIAHILNEYHHKIEWEELGGGEPLDGTELMRKQSSNSNPSSSSVKQCKLTCRYDIQIQNQKDFQVARRIIGSKGINMKKIIESALSLEVQQSRSFQNSHPNQFNLKESSNQILKLRLRGRGSGYKEGPQQMESQEELHLCISAKDEGIYNHACQSVQKLLQNVYMQYQEFTRKQGKCQALQIKRLDISSVSSPSTNVYIQSSQSCDQNNMEIDRQDSLNRMDSAKIQQYLELRNKARRELNFAQADRIRNYLRSCGVCLIDQKGRRGKAAEVTTWKYIL